jgi:hypothetical protein
MAIDDRSLPDRSMDQTLLSDDVYFDLDPAPIECTLGERQDEEQEPEAGHDFHQENVAEPTPPPLPASYPVLPYPPTIHKNPNFAPGYDTVSELSVDQYSKAPPQAVEMEYIDGVDLGGFYMKDTPRTVPMGYLEGMEVTAWNTEGLDSTVSKRRTFNVRHLCFMLACLLLTVTAVLVPIGIKQAHQNESLQASSDLSSVGGEDSSSAPVGTPVPSSSPSERPSVRIDTDTTLEPTVERTSAPSSSPTASPTDYTSPPPTNGPTLTPSNDTSSSPTNEPSLSPTTLETDPPTSFPSAFPSTTEPTPSPTDVETSAPTEFPTIDTTTEPPTEAITTEPPTQEEETESPTVTETEASTTSSPTPLETTLDPTGCVDVVEMDRICYDSGDMIRISFENCDPVVGDWIGLYRNPDAIDPAELEEPDIWAYTCGNRDCFDLYEFGELRFSFGSSLPEGTYGTYMVREALSPPYSSFAMTTFEVSGNCEG